MRVSSLQQMLPGPAILPSRQTSFMSRRRQWKSQRDLRIRCPAQGLDVSSLISPAISALITALGVVIAVHYQSAGEAKKDIDALSKRVSELDEKQENISMQITILDSKMSYWAGYMVGMQGMAFVEEKEFEAHIDREQSVASTEGTPNGPT